LTTYVRIPKKRPIRARSVRHRDIRRNFGIAGLLIVSAMILAGCSEEPASPSIAPTVTADPSAKYKDLAINGIKEITGVIDAAISDSGTSVSLLVIVESNTSISRAKELGSTFVRLLKLAGPDNNPTNELGTGLFDYLVAVVYSDNRNVVQGEKLREATGIAWQ
jgi:hypothetical protein